MECFYFVIQHQIVLKLLECHHGVVDCQSDLKLVCGSREFYFLEPFKIKDRSGIMWTFQSFYYVIQHQIVFKLLECHPGVVDCQSELKFFCGSREFYFLKPSKITDRRGGIWDLECFYFVIQHQIVLKLLECHHGVVDCQSVLKLFCGSRELYFLKPSKITDRSGIMWNLESFYYVIQHQIVLKLLECHPGVVDCQSELKLFCGSREFYFFKAIHNHRQKRWNMRFWVLLLCNSKSDCLETAWVLSWGSGLSIWIEIVLWKQGVSFLDLSKITGMSGRVWDLESFYYLIQHQIVLKLLECHPGVVDCQSELEFLCGNREFAFESHPKSQTEDVEYEIWSACIM